jgi:spermidine/putrescine-binding protein
MEKPKKRAISFTVTETEYQEVMMYAVMKGHGGQFPVSNFAHYSLFQQMKKYPLKQAEIDKYMNEYGNAANGPRAVQPWKPKGNSNGG